MYVHVDFVGERLALGAGRVWSRVEEMVEGM